MVGMDPEDAARDLAEADQRLHRGAELALPHSRWWYPAICLVFAWWGAVWDVPASWRWILMLALAPAILVVAVIPWRRARPLPVRLGWRTWLSISFVAIIAIGATLCAGLALQTLAVPLPFTLSGLLLGMGVSVLTSRIRHWRGSYVQQVRRGQW